MQVKYGEGVKILIPAEITMLDYDEQGPIYGIESEFYGGITYCRESDIAEVNGHNVRGIVPEAVIEDEARPKSKGIAPAQQYVEIDYSEVVNDVVKKITSEVSKKIDQKLKSREKTSTEAQPVEKKPRKKPETKPKAEGKAEKTSTEAGKKPKTPQRVATQANTEGQQEATKTAATDKAAAGRQQEKKKPGRKKKSIEEELHDLAKSLSEDCEDE